MLRAVGALQPPALDVANFEREDPQIHRAQKPFRQWPGWIAYVTQSKSGRTLYFNGRGLLKLKGQRRAEAGGNYVDMRTGGSFWVSGVKKNGQDRHWAGSGKVLIEAAAVADDLKTMEAEALDTSRYSITESIVQTDIERLSELANSLGM